MSQTDKQSLELFAELIDLIHILRSPGGCPWDREQTHASLMPKFREEVDEVQEAIEKNDDENLGEELGDVLLNVLMQIEIGEENGKFTLNHVIKNLISKLIRRHPHVFGDEKLNTPEEVLKRWHEIKAEEKA
jgi:tetrapyrrole methylase family protein/MazG family protein